MLAGNGDGLAQLRRILLGLVLFGIVGLSLDLLLLEHTESASQWIPIVVLGCGFLGGVAAGVRPTRHTIRLFQVIMALSVAAGLLGLYLHYRSNLEFELETDPSIRGLALLWASLRGAIPALAPGALVQLGLLGLVYTYRHPGLGRGTHTQPTEQS